MTCRHPHIRIRLTLTEVTTFDSNLEPPSVDSDIVMPSCEPLSARCDTFCHDCRFNNIYTATAGSANYPDMARWPKWLQRHMRHMAVKLGITETDWRKLLNDFGLPPQEKTS